MRRVDVVLNALRDREDVCARLIVENTLKCKREGDGGDRDDDDDQRCVPGGDTRAKRIDRSLLFERVPDATDRLNELVVVLIVDLAT